MYKKTITLFNFHNGYWYKQKLANVDLIVDRSAIISQYGENCADTAKLHMHYSKDGANIKVDGAIYKESSEYTGADNTFTLRSGENATFFIDGDISGTFPVDDADYREGFYNFANKTYEKVFVISSVAIYYEIPHFEVMAK